MATDVESLLTNGRYAEAAAELRRRGDLERAQGLYEKLWDFRSAADVARERGDRPELLRLLIDGKFWSEAQQLGHALATGARGEQERAAEIYERRRMWAEAAQLRELLGELERAHALYEQAQLLIEVARLNETLGRPREAGMAYERFLASEPTSAECGRARLQLGQILSRFGRHEEAARQLQRAIADPSSPAEIVLRARRELVVALDALDLPTAAESILDELRRNDPHLGPLGQFVAEAHRLRSIARTEDPQSLLLGGRYAVVRLLGSGGMGRVYLARDQLSGRDVAVKVVPPATDLLRRSGYERFVREAEIVSSVHHPNIVGQVAFHQELGLLAMEFMAGGTLADRIPSPIAPSTVRTLLQQLVSGLQAAHAHGVIHRDIKPANIFFSGSGEAKLGDFGVAHLQDLGATQTAGFIGTLAYMAPEQISGAPLQFSTDVYALGVTAFQTLTGRLPFVGPDFVAQHLGDQAPRPTSLRPSLHPQWDALCARCLEKDPKARFDSLDELARTLAALPVDPPTTVSLPSTAATPGEAPPRPPVTRYAPSGTIATSEISVLIQATDTQLGREVILEEFTAGYANSAEGAVQFAWLRAMARHGGPEIQRVLRFERLADGRLQVAFEAIVGRPTVPRELSLNSRLRLTRALDRLAAESIAHGNVAGSLVQTEHGVTLLVAGRSAPRDATPDSDRAALNEC